MAENLKVLAAFPTPLEAEMAKNRLAAAGIQAFLADDQTVGWLWHLGTALPGVKVLVAESDLPEAIEVLEIAQQEQVEAQAPAPWACPNCGTEVEGGMEVCWACGTTVEGVRDTGFRDADAMTPAGPVPAGPREAPGPWLAFLITFCVPMLLLDMLIGIDFLLWLATDVISAAVLLSLLAGDLLLVVGLFHWIYYYPSAALGPTEAQAQPTQAPPEARCAEEAEEPQAADSYAAARRACLAAVLGMFLCPLVLNLYSIWLIVRHELYRRSLGRRARVLVYAAIAINTVVCAAALLAFLLADWLGFWGKGSPTP